MKGDQTEQWKKDQGILNKTTKDKNQNLKQNKIYLLSPVTQILPFSRTY